MDALTNRNIRNVSRTIRISSKETRIVIRAVMELRLGIVFSFWVFMKIFSPAAGLMEEAF